MNALFCTGIVNKRRTTQSPLPAAGFIAEGRGRSEATGEGRLSRNVGAALATRCVKSTTDQAAGRFHSSRGRRAKSSVMTSE